MQPRVLWIEDSARLELASLAGPVYYRGTCDLTLAEDVTVAVQCLQSQPYDAVIVDIRLPPGRDPQWRTQYQRAGASKVTAQLGLKLLSWLVNGDRTILTGEPPGWIGPRRLAVFSVETRREIAPSLETLGISLFEEKTAGMTDDTLDRLIRRVLEQTAAEP